MWHHPRRGPGPGVLPGGDGLGRRGGAEGRDANDDVAAIRRQVPGPFDLARTPIALGVDPKAQGHGLGKLLGEKVLDQFHRLGVTRIHTLVDPETASLEPYFKSLGVTEAPTKVLVKGER